MTAVLSSLIHDRSRNQVISQVTAVAGVAATTYTLWKLLRCGTDWPPADHRPRIDVYQKHEKFASRKRAGYKNFPPPYPNGWCFVCPSSKLPKGGVLPLQVWGKHLVVFRGEDGVAGVLDAFCPHMATHMGYGGFVKGNTLVCPYHEWQFNPKGDLVKMPFGGRATAENGIASCNVGSYPVVERFGMIFAWFHADGGKPFHIDLLDRIHEKGLLPVTRIVDTDFMMHCMEPSHNSADWYHFKTVHSTFCQHWRSKFAITQVAHELLPARMALDGSVDDDGRPIDREDWLIIDEKLKSMKLFGFIPVTAIAQQVQSQIRFNGPMISAFCIRFPFFGDFQMFMHNVPTEPFKTHVEYWPFAGPRFPWILAYLLAKAIIWTVNQDREVWEHRAHPDPRNPVRGDFDYKHYDEWMGQFYTKSSTTWETAYEDLTF